MTTTLDSPVIYGHEAPRLFTAPLRPLTPETSAGYAAIDFATQVMKVRLLPWQRWWLIHVLELKPNGQFRFSVVLTLVARQNGKTWLLRTIVLWFLYVRSRKLNYPGLIVSAAQDLRIAREFWLANVDVAQTSPEMSSEIINVRYANGEQCLTVDSGARYMLTATTRGAGRGLSIDCLILDELREQRTRAPWAALQSTTVARPGALTLCISNQGDDESLVLNDLRSSALAETDASIGLFEWSAPEDCDPDDPQEWAKANPGLGRTITLDKLRSIRATSSDADWRTENLCQRVDTLDSAVDPSSWRACADNELTLKDHRDQITACIDVAVESGHVTLAIAAPLPHKVGLAEVVGAMAVGGAGALAYLQAREDASERFGVEIAAVWSSTDQARREMPELLRKLKPRALGWYPGGAAGVLGVEIAASHGVSVGKKRYDGTFFEHSPGVIDIIGADVSATCMTFSDIVKHRGLIHRSSPLLDEHISQCSRYETGEIGAWRFARKGQKPIDAAYAAAGAVHLARSLPRFVPPPRSRVF